MEQGAQSRRHPTPCSPCDTLFSVCPELRLASLSKLWVKLFCGSAPKISKACAGEAAAQAAAGIAECLVAHAGLVTSLQLMLRSTNLTVVPEACWVAPHLVKLCPGLSLVHPLIVAHYRNISSYSRACVAV